MTECGRMLIGWSCCELLLLHLRDLGNRVHVVRFKWAYRSNIIQKQYCPVVYIFLRTAMYISDTSRNHWIPEILLPEGVMTLASLCIFVRICKFHCRHPLIPILAHVPSINTPHQDQKLKQQRIKWYIIVVSLQRTIAAYSKGLSGLSGTKRAV